ncbi:MAG: leucine-rich repeat domain-containing protein [Clostridia bacterium]|nr:leucine-rich repeat domain-containing protein [Clostridia bacterium]
MKKNIATKILSVILVIIVGVVPLSDFAGMVLPNYGDFTIKAEAATDNVYGYKISSAGEVTITDFYENTEHDIVIPTRIAGYPVVEIGDNAFSNAKNLSSVVIPEGVKIIGAKAFDNCAYLRSVTIPNTVEMIESEAFFGCQTLTDLNLGTGVKTIGNLAFHFCSHLEEITIPKSTTNLATDAFTSCSSLKRILVSEGNTVYSNDDHGVLFNKDKTMLLKCPSGFKKTSYTIPNSVKKLET